MKHIINGFSLPQADFWVRINGILTESQRYSLLSGEVVIAQGRVCQIIDDGEDDSIEREWPSFLAQDGDYTTEEVY